MATKDGGLWIFREDTRRRQFERFGVCLQSEYLARATISYQWKDRLTRFGFGYLKNHAEDLGARVEVVNEHEKRTPHEELVKDLLAIVTSFAGRLYGMRSNKAKKVVESVKRAVR